MIKSILQAAMYKIAVVAPDIAMALIILLVSFLIAGLTKRAIDRGAERFAGGKKQVIMLGASVARILILILGVITSLGTMGINVSAMVAGLGLSGFALGFALKDVLSNLLSGAMMLIYQPFKSGDRIVVSGCEGEVTEINLRYTVLQGKDREYMIPNSAMFKTLIQLLPKNRSEEPKEA